MDSSGETSGTMQSVSIDVLMMRFEALLDKKLSCFATGEEVTLLADEIRRLRDECCTLKNKIAVMENTERELTRSMEICEQNNRKGNLIFRGLPNVGNPKRAVKDFCKNVLGLTKECHIFKAYVIKGTGQPSILAEFSSNATVSDVLSQARVLKGTNYSIFRDLPYALRERRRVLAAIKKQIGIKNKTLKVFLRGDVLQVAGVRFQWNEKTNYLVSDNKDGETIFRNAVSCDITSVLQNAALVKQANTRDDIVNEGVRELA